MLTNLYEYEVLIDAEGRCPNYTLHGYVASDNWMDAKVYIHRKWIENGENVLKVTIKKNIGLVDIAKQS